MNDETVFLALHNAAPRTVKVTRDGSGLRASLPATRRDPLVLIALVLLVLVLPLALLVVPLTVLLLGGDSTAAIIFTVFIGLFSVSGLIFAIQRLRSVTLTLHEQQLTIAKPGRGKRTLPLGEITRVEAVADGVNLHLPDETLYLGSWLVIRGHGRGVRTWLVTFFDTVMAGQR